LRQKARRAARSMSAAVQPLSANNPQLGRASSGVHRGSAGPVSLSTVVGRTIRAPNNNFSMIAAVCYSGSLGTPRGTLAPGRDPSACAYSLGRPIYNNSFVAGPRNLCPPINTVFSQKTDDSRS
jgi:hypothetical protein